MAEPAVSAGELQAISQAEENAATENDRIKLPNPACALVEVRLVALTRLHGKRLQPVWLQRRVVQACGAALAGSSRVSLATLAQTKSRPHIL